MKKNIKNEKMKKNVKKRKNENLFFKNQFSIFNTYFLKNDFRNL